MSFNASSSPLNYYSNIMITYDFQKGQLIEDGNANKGTLKRTRAKKATAKTKKVAEGKCFFCNTTETPEWRSGPDGNKLCNGCGLRYAAKVKKLKGEDKSTPSKVAQVWSCAECNTHETTSRRPGPQGPATLCNPCGLKWRREQKNLTIIEFDVTSSTPPVETPPRETSGGKIPIDSLLN